MSEYKCDHHELTLICKHCSVNLYRKYKRLLEFVKKMQCTCYGDGNCTGCHIQTILKEIGEA